MARSRLARWRPREARSFAPVAPSSASPRAGVRRPPSSATALAVYAAVSFALPAAGGPRPAALPPRLRAALRRARRLPERAAPADAGDAARRGAAPRGRPAREPSSASALLYALSIVAWFCVARRVTARSRRSRRPPRCSHTRATSSSSTSWRATRSSRPRSRSSRSCWRVPSSVRPLGARGRPRAGRRRARPRAPGRPGAPAARAGAAPRRAWRARPRVEAVPPSPSRRVVPLVALAGAQRAARADDFTVVRGGSASLLFRTFVADRIVEPGNGTASAELARAVVAGAAPERAVPVARHRPRDVLLVGELADARRPHRALRPDVGLGRRLPAPRPRRRARRSARTRRRTRAASRSDVWRLLLWPLYGAGRGRDGRARPSGARRVAAAARAAGAADRTTSRSRPRARRRTSRRRTGGSARCGRRRPSTRSSSEIRPTRRARPRSTAR